MTVFWNGNSGFDGFFGLRQSDHVTGSALGSCLSDTGIQSGPKEPLSCVCHHSVDTLMCGVEGLEYLSAKLFWYKDFILLYGHIF